MESGPKLNTLFIVPTLRRAGAETQVVELASALAGLDWKVLLVSLDHPLDQGAIARRAKVEHEHVQRKHFLDFACMQSVGRLIDEHAIDVVHCTLQYSVMIGYAARLFSRRRPPVIAAIHTTLNVDLRHEWADRLLYRPLLRKCARVIFVCENQKQYWLRRASGLTDRAVVVHNGVETSWFDPDIVDESSRALGNKLNIPSDAKVIACIAGFRPEKAHKILLDVFAKLYRGDSRARLVLAGDGPLREQIRRQVQRLGLSDAVRLAGIIEDVRPLLKLAKFTVLSSIAVETFSMAMLESMAMATPVVATEIGGANEAITAGRDGLLVPPGDAEALFEAMNHMLSDTADCHRMGAEAREKVISNFSKQRMVIGTREILSQAVSETRNR